MKVRKANQLDHKVGMTKYNIIYANYTELATAISVIHLFSITSNRRWHLANPSHLWDIEIGTADAVWIAGRFWKQ